MSFTIRQRINKVKILAKKYNTAIKLDDQIITFNIQLSRNEVYRRWQNVAEHLFRKSITVAHGDLLPADYVTYAGFASYQLSGAKKSFTFIPVEEVAGCKKNSMFLALASTPKIYFVDQAIMALPDSTMTNPATGNPYTNITGITFNYYWRPVNLFASDGSIADSTTDNMPIETEYQICRGAWERCIVMQLQREAAMALIERNMKESAQAADEFYRDEFLVVQDVEMNKRGAQ